MTGYARLFEQMMEQGQAMARALNPALESFQAAGFDKLVPTMSKEFMELAWGNALNPEGLDAKTRLLALIAGMTVQGVPVEPVFRTTVRHAREAGATGQEIVGVIGQMAILGGVPAMTKALGAARAVLEESDGEETA